MTVRYYLRQVGLMLSSFIWFITFIISCNKNSSFEFFYIVVFNFIYEAPCSFEYFSYVWSMSTFCLWCPKNSFLRKAGLYQFRNIQMIAFKSLIVNFWQICIRYMVKVAYVFARTSTPYHIWQPCQRAMPSGNPAL